MRLTIISDDKTVGVDGEFYLNVDLTGLDSTIHAVQWYGEYGEIEYKTKYENNILVKPKNLLINDVTPYKFAVDAWQAAKSFALEQKAIADAAMAEEANRLALINTEP